MNKAYDRLEWVFLKKVLLAFGFCSDWVKSVMKMVSSVSYKYKVNGFVSQKLVPHRGLRQGDPLSPYLFILAADALSLMLTNAKEKGMIQGVQLCEGAPILTHSFFADDALLFVRATTDNIYQVVKILNSYTAASGQKINLSKSGVICGKHMDGRLKIRLASLLQMQLWDDPGKYLGLPADWSRSKNSALSWIKDRILAKIEGWKENLLNQAGKEVLIKAVLQAIPNYTMSIVRFPKNFCQKICSAIARFWWSSYGKNRGIHWKSWTALTAGKWEGGLGFKDLADLNSSLLAKQAWRVFHNPEALWVKVLKALYFPNTDFSYARRKRCDSWAWASLLHGRDVILKSSRWIVGDGKSINIKMDRWLASGDLIGQQRGGQLICVKELIDVNNREWDGQKIRLFFDPDLARKIVQTPLRRIQGKDTLCWPPAKSGDYSVKSGYYEVRKQRECQVNNPSTSIRIQDRFWRDIWGAKIPQKIKIFLWKASHNILPLRETLWKKKISQSIICPICKRDEETLEHAFLLCDWTRPVWFASQLQISIDRNRITTLQQWLEGWFNQLQNRPDFKDYGIMVLSCTLWGIWKSRNSVCFEGKEVDPKTTIFQINLLLKDCELYINEVSGVIEERVVNSSRVGKYWRPPVSGGLKINCDASFNKELKRGYADIIIKGDSGEFISGLTKQIWASSPLVAEALALREALFLAVNLGLQVVTFEGDNLDLIKACRKEVSRRDIINILQDIWDMKGNFTRCGFTWVSRQGNMAAHLVATLADRGVLPGNWCLSLPLVLKEELQVDFSGIRLSTNVSHQRGDDPGNEVPHIWVRSESELNSFAHGSGVVSSMADDGAGLTMDKVFLEEKEDRVFDDGG